MVKNRPKNYAHLYLQVQVLQVQVLQVQVLQGDLNIWFYNSLKNFKIYPNFSFVNVQNV